jgi:hypothetical protein
MKCQRRIAIGRVGKNIVAYRQTMGKIGAGYDSFIRKSEIVSNGSTP